ncbi:MAG: FAD-dependent oxidoreductase, partial [Desulfatiglandales bacterium]
YCSSVCCMYAIKQAIVAKEHAPYDLDTAIFFMDMRTHGKGYEQCYNDSENRHKVRFVRARIHSLLPNRKEGGVMIHYADEEGVLHEEPFDMAVLSVGLEMDPGTLALAQKLGLDLTSGGFIHTDTFEPVSTNRAGIFVCGVVQGPKDIPQSVIEAGAAAQAAGSIIASERGTLIKEIQVPQERDIRGERPQVGVFVCSCGINIGGVVDVKEVAEYALTLPYVTYATVNLYSCSQDTQNLISKTIEEKGLNRIVVAACSPKTHEPLFQETLAAAGLNKYLLEFVNIRNHDSWVHKDDPKAATDKAKDLVRMAVSKVLLLEPSSELELPLNQRALIVGGGISSISAALRFSENGFPSTIVEREGKLGGNANFLYKTKDGKDVREELQKLIDKVSKDPNIEILTNAEIEDVEGYVGNFKTKISHNGNVRTVEHGVVVIATGAREFQPKEYLYGVNPNVVTGLNLDMYMRTKPEYLKNLNQVVFIQCVGSREPQRPYCSRVCCTHTVLSALHLKELNPDMQVFVLYRDLRTYGERENLYKEAREKGVFFIRYELENKPIVEEKDGRLSVKVKDHVLQRDVLLNPDLIVLQSAIVANDVDQIAKFFKIPIDEQGFFVEAHVKLAPSSFATEGVYLAGLAHYPKPIDESIAQAGAAVANAIGLLSKGKV